MHVIKAVLLLLVIAFLVTPAPAQAVWCSENYGSCLLWCTGGDTPYGSYGECKGACKGIYCV